QHAGRAVPALQAVMHRERPPQTRHQLVAVEALDGPDLLLLACDGERDARPHGLAVDEHGTRATYAMLAAEMGARPMLGLAQEVAEMYARLHIAAHGTIVDG